MFCKTKIVIFLKEKFKSMGCSPLYKLIFALKSTVNIYNILCIVT